MARYRQIGLGFAVCLAMWSDASIVVAREHLALSADAQTAIGLAPAVGSVRLDEKALAHILDLRAWVGLSNDQQFVDSLYASTTDAYVSAKGLVGGLRFSFDEADDVYAISQLDWAADVIAQKLVLNFGDDVLAGVQVRARVVSIFCKGCDKAKVLNVVESVEAPVGEGNRVEIVDVRLSLTELRTAQSLIADYLDGAGTKYSGTGIDVANNAVRVVGRAGVETTVRELFPDVPIAFVLDDVGQHDEVSKSDTLGYGVVEGGQQIYRTNLGPVYGSCTSGFAVQSGYGPFILTAGHCANGGTCSTGQGWTQGSMPLGVMAACNLKGSVDGGLISTANVRNTIGRVHRNSSDYFRPINWGWTTQNIVGHQVCQHGYASFIAPNFDWQCGVINDFAFRPTGITSDGLPWNADFLGLTYASNYGDSGAALSWANIYGNAAVGIHKSRDGTTAYATKWERLSTLWGLTLTAP